MRTLWALARCSHPEPVVAVTSVCGVLAVLAGRGGWGTVWVMLAVAAGQVFVGWTNDYIDRRRDTEVQRADKPLARGEISSRSVAIAATVAGLAVVPLSLASGVPATMVHVIGVVSATAYNLGLKSTWLSVVPYAVSFAMVPAFITLGLAHPHWPPAWVSAAASLTGVGGHFAQARPDVERDRRQRVLGLPQVFGDRGSAIAAAVFLVAGAAAIAYGSRNPLPLVVVLPAVGVAVMPPVAAFRFTLLTAAVTVVAFVATAGTALR
jgi:4-hydroxybenzoate polyprenyltransferase